MLMLLTVDPQRSFQKVFMNFYLHWTLYPLYFCQSCDSRTFSSSKYTNSEAKLTYGILWWDWNGQAKRLNWEQSDNERGLQTDPHLAMQQHSLL